MMTGRYRSLVSSDWNECLAPCGPFDFIAFTYPRLAKELSAVFRQYTGNRISLSDAIRRIEQIVPHPVTQQQMDAYLDQAFTAYHGVANLIEWCVSNDILFMINTTGMIGYFQRVFARGLLPRVPVISAHPMVRYPCLESDPPSIFELSEIKHKSSNTAAVIRSLGIPADKIIIMGDSGGDGPHFEWGSKIGAYLIGSMTKASLDEYCRRKNFRIDMRFGMDYSKGGSKDNRQEMLVDFMDLAAVIEEVVNA